MYCKRRRHVFTADIILMTCKPYNDNKIIH